MQAVPAEVKPRETANHDGRRDLCPLRHPHPRGLFGCCRRRRLQPSRLRASRGREQPPPPCPPAPRPDRATRPPPRLPAGATSVVTYSVGGQGHSLAVAASALGTARLDAAERAMLGPRPDGVAIDRLPLPPPPVLPRPVPALRRRFFPPPRHPPSRPGHPYLPLSSHISPISPSYLPRHAGNHRAARADAAPAALADRARGRERGAALLRGPEPEPRRSRD